MAPSTRGAVNRFGNDLFADARFARDQNGNVTRCEALDQVVDGAHGGSIDDDGGLAEGALQGGLARQSLPRAGLEDQNCVSDVHGVAERKARPLPRRQRHVPTPFATNPPRDDDRPVLFSSPFSTERIRGRPVRSESVSSLQLRARESQAILIVNTSTSSRSLP